jgi:molybdopterin-biosynthesis enzyme MoeA-like protein
LVYFIRFFFHLLTGWHYQDITYQSLAKAFDQKLVHHQETIDRMKGMNKHRRWIGTQNTEQRAATLRMALFPEKAEVLFVAEDIWVVIIPIPFSQHF